MSAAALSAAALSAAALSAAALSAAESSVVSDGVLKEEPMISTSSVPAGNSILRVLLTEFVWVSVNTGSSPSAKIIKSSSSPSNVESKRVRSKVISKVPGDSVTPTVKINEIKSKSASTPETVIPVAV